MNEPTIDNMVKRLDRLERENRWFRRMGAVVLVGITALVLMGQAQPNKVAKVVEAEKFVLRNGESGKVLAELKGESKSGYVGLDLYDFPGYKRAEFRVSSLWGPALILKAEDGDVVASLGYSTDGDGLTLSNSLTSNKAFLGSNGELSLYGDYTSINLFGPKGKQRVRLKGGKDIGSLSLHGPKSKAHLVAWKDTAQLSLDSDTRTEEELTRLFDRDVAKYIALMNKSGISLVTTSREGSQIELRDPNGKSRAVLGSASLETTHTGAVTKRAESSLVLFDKQGKVLWKAP